MREDLMNLLKNNSPLLSLCRNISRVQKCNFSENINLTII